MLGTNRNQGEKNVVGESAGRLKRSKSLVGERTDLLSICSVNAGVNNH
jgi:hypothetical protein